jgi:translation initiation factor 3 subunit C
MNRFWAGDSSDEDERDNASGSGSEDEVVAQPQALAKQTDRKFGLAFDESDSESEDEHREVKSQKDRTWDSLREGITKIKNARKNNDWPLIQDEFANVNKLVEKSKMMIIQHGMPPVYIKMLVEMEDHVQNALKDKENIKRMKPLVARALNQMKLQVRKHNENYKDEINNCREHPEKYEDVVVPEKSKKGKKKSDSSSEDEDDSDESDSDKSDKDEDDKSSGSDSDSDKDKDDSSSSSEDEKPKAKAAPVKKSAPKVAFKDNDDESDDDSSVFQDEDSESSSSEDERKELTGRAKWLKKKGPTKAEQEEISKKDKKKTEKSKHSDRKREAAEKNETVSPVKKPVIARVEEKLTEEELDKRIIDLVAARGRKGTDNRETLRQLEVLTKSARLLGPMKEIPVIMHFVSSMFDSQRGIDDYMDHQQWYTAYRSLHRVLYLLETHKGFTLETLGTDELVMTSEVKGKAGGAGGSEEAVSGKSVKSLRVVGSIESFVLRLEDEYNKSLQQINPHTQV